ncbi:MAG TPA: hypothetical protein VFX21_15175, partial [Acidimicrobiia bacterium]|nr:hypothetical protein [Acidimicrobiia bacterium]
MTRRDERGSTLIIALAMIAVVGLIITSGVQFSGVSLRSSNNALRPNRASLYAADGALQTAIEFVRDNPGAAADLLGACPANTLTYPDPGSGSTVSVALCPQDGSFEYDGPYQAVLVTLSTRADEGLDLSHNGDVDIGGHVWSNSYINLSNPTNAIVKGGNVYAWTSCNRPGGITVDPGFVKNCNASAAVGAVPEVGKDPAIANPADWTPAVPASFVPQTVATCSGGAATLTPGIYEHGKDLSALTKSCNNVTLSPGVYYLNVPADGTGGSL